MLMKQAPENVLRTSMELGGNAPFIVFEDADIDDAVVGAMGAKMRNMGEACTAANRFIVHESVAQEFAEKFAAKIAELKLGNGMDDGVTCGPLIEDKAREEIAEKVQEALDSGARALVGGKKADGKGYFYEPTVLVDVPRDVRIVREEIFGPVAPIITFADECEAYELANSTEYGLASYVYSKDYARQMRAADYLEFGMMGWNVGVMSNAAAAFDGVRQSGLGREGGDEGLAEYTYTQYLGVKDPYE